METRKKTKYDGSLPLNPSVDEKQTWFSDLFGQCLGCIHIWQQIYHWWSMFTSHICLMATSFRNEHAVWRIPTLIELDYFEQSIPRKFYNGTCRICKRSQVIRFDHSLNISCTPQLEKLLYLVSLSATIFVNSASTNCPS